MSDPTLAVFVKAAAEKFAIPGIAVAVWADGSETYACHGVTSLQDPRPVDEHTLYSLGSISKTFTATAMMRLVAQGKVDLDAPVRRYLPELVLPNEQWTETTRWPSSSRSWPGSNSSRPPEPAPPTARSATTWPAGSSRRSRA